MRYMREFSHREPGASGMLTLDSGCEPLTPDDIAEVVVFVAGRRENVVVADTLIYPSHQVRASF